MKKKCNYAYGLTEVILVIAILAVFVGVAISMFSTSAQNQLEQTKLDVTKNTIAEIYSTNFNAISHDEVTAMFTNENSFMNGFAQYFNREDITESSFAGKSFIDGTPATFKAIQ